MIFLTLALVTLAVQLVQAGALVVLAVVGVRWWRREKRWERQRAMWAAPRRKDPELVDSMHEGG